MFYSGTNVARFLLEVELIHLQVTDVDLLVSVSHNTYLLTFYEN